MDVVAHNIANMSTAAFKKERSVFREHLMDVPGAAATTGGKIAFVMDHGVVRDLNPGTMVPTSNPLDLFINGRAYFTVQANDGQTVYTRNGRMSLDADRNLTLLSGEKVLDENGQAIQFDEDDVDISISDDGTISTNNGDRGKIGIVSFANEQNMKRRGSSLYETDEAPQAPENMTEFSIRQKAYEGSNVNPIEAMVEMIDVMRAYERASKQSTGYEDMRKDSLDRLARMR
jgi:flagellar basal-body rod protein FlgF